MKSRTKIRAGGIRWNHNQQEPAGDRPAAPAKDSQVNLRTANLYYMTAYLLGGGAGLLLAPRAALLLLGSNAASGDIMPRLLGLMMMVLGGLVLQFARARDFRYDNYSLIARSLTVVTLAVLYVRYRDPLPLVLCAIVAAGLLPAFFASWTERGQVQRPIIHGTPRYSAMPSSSLSGDTASPVSRGRFS